jgi:hypothetical protein
MKRLLNVRRLELFDGPASMSFHILLSQRSLASVEISSWTTSAPLILHRNSPMLEALRHLARLILGPFSMASGRHLTRRGSTRSVGRNGMLVDVPHGQVTYVRFPSSFLVCII